MSKFQKGDRVKYMSQNDNSNINQYNVFFGMCGTVRNDSTSPFIDWDGLKQYWAAKEIDLELIKEEKKMFIKSDLKNGMFVQRRDGSWKVMLMNDLCDLDTLELATYNLSDNDYDDNLLIKDNDYEDNDIMKVISLNKTDFYDFLTQNTNDLEEKSNLILKYPSNTVWFDRATTTKEMTVAEISKALGYDVKIVK